MIKKIVALIALGLMIFGTFASYAYSATLSDIANDQHQDAIEYLQEEGIVTGHQDGTFKPNDTLNRAELLKLAVLTAIESGKLKDPPLYLKNCFLDVKDEWFAPYVCFAKYEGWVEGYKNEYFKPEQAVNKVEALKMIINVNQLTLKSPVTLKYKDIIKGEWYYQYLEIGQSQDLLEETGSNYSPANPITRSQTSEILYRLLTGNTSTPPITPIITPSTASNCSPLTTTTGKVITVSTMDELSSAVEDANQNGNTTILIEDGDYQLSERLMVTGNNVIIRSESGNRENVVLRGAGMNGEVGWIFGLTGDNITIADLTLRDVGYHAIQVHGELDSDNTLLHNLHIMDTNEQMVKVSYNADNTSISSDNGILECSTLEYTAGIGPQWYIGGIDGHNTESWIVRDNVFKNIISPEEALAEHAVHFWSNAKNTLVENNTIINCDRGIGFGLGDRGHIGGTIKGNHIYHNSTFGDVGIALENALNVLVEDNIILFENDYKNAIEYRFEGSNGITIKNNTTNKGISARDGASASVSSNIINALLSNYVNPASGNFTEL